MSFEEKLAFLRHKVRKGAQVGLGGTDENSVNQRGAHTGGVHPTSKIDPLPDLASGSGSGSVGFNGGFAPSPFSFTPNLAFSTSAPLQNQVPPSVSFSVPNVMPVPMMMGGDPTMMMHMVMNNHTSKMRQIKKKNQSLRTSIRRRKKLQEAHQKMAASVFKKEEEENKQTDQLEQIMSKIQELQRHVTEPIPMNQRWQQPPYQQPLQSYPQQQQQHWGGGPPQQEDPFQSRGDHQHGQHRRSSYQHQEQQQQQHHQQQQHEIQESRHQQHQPLHEGPKASTEQVPKAAIKTDQKHTLVTPQKSPNPNNIRTPPPTDEKNKFDRVLEEEEAAKEEELFNNLDDILNDATIDDDDDDDDDVNVGTDGKKRISAAKQAKLDRIKKAETYRKQHEGKNYDECIKPMYRYLRNGEPIPIGPDGKYNVLKGISLFRAVAWHVLSFYAGPKLRVIKLKLTTKPAEKKGFESVLKFCFDQVKSWLNKEVKLAVNSILLENTLDLDVLEQQASTLGGFRSFFGFGKKKESKEDKFNARMMKLKIRVKGIIKGLTKALPPDTILDFFTNYFEEGNYFPDEFLLQCEIDRMEFNDVVDRKVPGDVGGTKRILANR
jgi:hypothetical protein